MFTSVFIPASAREHLQNTTNSELVAEYRQAQQQPAASGAAGKQPPASGAAAEEPATGKASGYRQLDRCLQAR